MFTYRSIVLARDLSLLGLVVLSLLVGHSCANAATTTQSGSVLMRYPAPVQDTASLLVALDTKPVYNGNLQESMRVALARSAAATALSERGVRAAIPSLKGMLNEQSEPYRMVAAESLLRLGDASGLPTARELLQSAWPSIVIRAARLLARSGDDTGLCRIKYLLSSNLATQRRDAMRAFGESSNPQEYVGPLKDGLNDPDTLNRDAALYILQKKGTPEALGLIAGLLTSPDVRWRHRAALSLNWSHTPAAIPYMIGALTNDDRDVRETAAVGLAWYAGHAICPGTKRQVRTLEGAQEAQRAYQRWWDENKSTFDMSEVGPLRFSE